MKQCIHFVQILAGVLAVFLCVSPLSVLATSANNIEEKTYTYSTGKQQGKDTVSKTWVQASDTTWTMDIDDDGIVDVMLESSLNGDGQQEWTYTFYVEDDQQAYYVYEQMTENGALPLKKGYTSSGSDSSEENPVSAVPYEPGKVDAATHTYTITNHKDHKPVEVIGTGSLRITKTVANPENMMNPDQKFQFEVTLTGNTDALKSAIAGDHIYGDTPFQDGVAMVALGHGESITLTDIPEGIAYKVREEYLEGYDETSWDGNKGTIVADQTVEATFVNTSLYTPPAPRNTVDIHIAKQVEDVANASGNTPFTLHVILDNLDPYQTVTWALDGSAGSDDTSGSSNAEDTDGTDAGNANAAGTPVTADDTGFAAIDITLTHGQSATITGIPVGAHYQVSEDGGEYTASYRVTDANAGAEGHTGTISMSNNTGTAGEALSTAKETAEDGEDVTITYTNRMTRVQDLVLIKQSLDEDGNVDTEDTTEYEFTITFTGLTPNTRIKTTNGIFIADDRGEIQVTMNVVAGQEVTFYDVPVGMTYRFVETGNAKIGSYDITADGPSDIKSASKANQQTGKDLSTGLIDADGNITDEVVDAGENATVTFTSRTPSTARLLVVKYDSDGKTQIGPAEFEIYRKIDDTPVLFAADGTSNVITVGENGESELLESPLFVKGEYYLVETKAPDGHTLNEAPMAFTIAKEHLDTTIRLEIKDNQIIVLPVTGGEGRNTIYIIAAALAALAAAGVAFQLHRRRTH